MIVEVFSEELRVKANIHDFYILNFVSNFSQLFCVTSSFRKLANFLLEYID